jgi:hypothetical protein
MSNTIKGFDYERYATVELTRAEWQERIAEAIKAGGFRRVMYGDTYVHACCGRIKAEIYADVPAPCAGIATDSRVAREGDCIVSGGPPSR